MAGTNNFLVFNEANNPTFTMSDADYYADLYRLNGLIPMIADPNAHNKMFRQWSIMVTALANIIASMNYNASDSDLATLQANLKSAIEDVAEAKVDSRITTLEDWKSSITATPDELNILNGVTASTSELNILDGLTASTSEINYLSGADSNIQQQINAITGVISNPFPAWTAEKVYEVGDICIANTFKSYQYLECVVAGESGTTTPSYVDVGQMITDNEVKWLVCDFRDSAPVGTYKTDIVQRKGWLKANGAEVNRTDYPRLWAWVQANSLSVAATNISTNPGKFGEGDGSTTFTLPNFEDYFIRYSFTRIRGTKQDSQMASHTHSCGNQDTSHTHTINNKSISHNHSYTKTDWTVSQQSIIGGTAGNYITPKHVSVNTDNNSIEHNHTAGNQSASHKHIIGNTGSGSNTYPDNITMQMYIKY